MRIALFYFSGSGNTKTVALKWKDSISSLGFECDLFNIEKDDFDFNNVNQYDKIGFAYPVHAFNAPKNVWKYAKRFPKLENEKKVFLLMVSGEPLNMNHSSGNKMLRILRRRNYKLENDYHYVMPYDLVFRHTEKRAAIMFETMNKLVPIDAYHYLVEGKKENTKKLHLVGWFIWLLRIEQWFAGVNGKLFRINKKKCIKCMKCVNNCPVKNIEYRDGKFIFHSQCLMCTRCAFHCPTDAFSIGILNSWKVNKPYSFKIPEIEEKDRHPKYCKKSYIRYYKEADEKIQNFEKRSAL